MTEIIQLQRDDDIWRKILPVILKDTKFYDVLDRYRYVKHWQEKSVEIEQVLKNLDPSNATSLYQELKLYKEIALNIDLFLLNIKEQMNVSPEELFDNYYSQLTERIGQEPDFSKLSQLIPISFISDPTLRLWTINNFKKTNKVENSHCLSIKATCYRDLKQPDKAIIFYKKSIALDDFNYAAWNNLGQIYEQAIHNYTEAKLAYEKAIDRKPDFDIPRINLGLILSDYFKDNAGAKKQYEEILTFDENNPKAHHNLSNIYREKEFFDLDKVEKHLIIAVNQNNLEATISYANFLKVYKKDIEGGNRFYQKAKELDTNNMYTAVIDFMIKSSKG